VSGRDGGCGGDTVGGRMNWDELGYWVPTSAFLANFLWKLGQRPCVCCSLKNLLFTDWPIKIPGRPNCFGVHRWRRQAQTTSHTNQSNHRPRLLHFSCCRSRRRRQSLKVCWMWVLMYCVFVQFKSLRFSCSWKLKQSMLTGFWLDRVRNVSSATA